jgi:hypothetical protein
MQEAAMWGWERVSKTSDEDETRERNKKNKEKGSYEFYVWETKYQAKITRDSTQLLEMTIQMQRKCQKHIKIDK